MRVKISSMGVDETAFKFIKRAGLEYDFDKLAEHSMKRIQMGAFQKGPVLTGFLTSNLLADENRRRTAGFKKGSWDLIDGTDYTLVQEYEHRTKSAFIRRSVWDEEPKFVKAIEKLARDGKWTL